MSTEKNTGKLTFIPDRPKFTPRILLGHPSTLQTYPSRESLLFYLSQFHKEAIDTLRQYPLAQIKGRKPVTDIYSFDVFYDHDKLVDPIPLCFQVDRDFDAYEEILLESECMRITQMQFSALEALRSIWCLGGLLSGLPVRYSGNRLEAAIREAMKLVFAAVAQDFIAEFEQKIINEINTRAPSKKPRPAGRKPFRNELDAALDHFELAQKKPSALNVWRYLKSKIGNGVILRVDPHTNDGRLRYQNNPHGAVKEITYEKFEKRLSHVKKYRVFR